MNSFFSSFWKYSVGIIVIFGLFFASGNSFPLIRYFFEHDAPLITIQNSIDGFGTVPQELKFRVQDEKSGLELIRVRVDQSRLNKELLKLDLPLNTADKELKLVIDGQKEGFKPGNVRVTIEAYDRSLDSNGAKLAFDVPVRFDKPEIELLTNQHNAVQGGMELVFYRVKADKIKETGVRVRNKEFSGFPATFLDPQFETVKGLYFSFFVIPTDYTESDKAPVIFARNSVGNESQHSFYYRVQSVKKRSWKYEVKDLSQTRFNGSGLEEYLSSLPYSEQRYWNDRLSRVVGTLMSPSIGDTLVVKDSRGAQSEVKNELLSFRFPYNKEIFSSGEGKIVSTADGKGYGKIAVIDHGFGLTSVFSNLDEVLVRKNEVIKVSDSVGKPAMLSQAKEGGFEYGLFYQGIPTRAIEWWDQGWVRDHILKKITDVKEGLGLNAPLESPQVMPKEVVERSLQTSELPASKNEYVDDERGREF